MAEFGIRFFVGNLLLCVLTSIFLTAKRALNNRLTSRMQFNLWFLFLGLLTVPFLPFRPIGFSRLFLWYVYDVERATLRTSPDSTYKIYDALFGLEEGIISPEDSRLA